MRSKFDEICHLSPEIWLSDDKMLKEPAARYCHDWEVVIVFVKKHGKLKMPTLLTSVQIHRRKYLENKLIVSIFYIELSFEINRLLKISLEKYTRRKLS